MRLLGSDVRNLLFLIIGLLAISITIISVYLTPDNLRGCSAVSQSGNCQAVDAIVAVSGGNTPVRAAEAIRLYQEGWSDTLIFSGAAADPSGPSNAEVMRRQAVQAGVPASAIKVESSSRTTRENAELVGQLLVDASGNGAKRIILVTSPYHQRRASLEFKLLADQGITIINHPTPNDPDWSKLWWLTPRGWWLAGGELVKIAVFYTEQSQ